MRITRTINYGWHTIKEEYFVICQKCRKKLKRTVSRGFNDLANGADITGYREELKDTALELSKQEIICNSCLKQNIEEPKVIDLVSELLKFQIKQIEEEQAKLDIRKREITTKFEKWDKQLFVYNGELYAQYSTRFDLSEKFRIEGYKISKKRPWETTIELESPKLEEIQYVDDTLDKRKERLRRND